MQRVDADRSRGRLRTSSIGTQSSRKYVGATYAVDTLPRDYSGLEDDSSSYVLVASEDYAILARWSHGVELLTQGELQHSGQPGVA